MPTFVILPATFNNGTLEVDRGISRLFDCPIAFEVDQVDEFLQTGWSVLLMGNA